MIGDIITVNGVELLVLDEIEGNPFVIALDTGIKTKFGDSNNYTKSQLRDAIDKWIDDKGFYSMAIPRWISLTAAMDDSTYGDLLVPAAPLTYDEYQKYRKIIYPHIKQWFWLVSPWSSGGADVCGVGSSGTATYYGYYNGSEFAPAFILNNKKILDMKHTSLSDFSFDELIAEI